MSRRNDYRRDDSDSDYENNHRRRNNTSNNNTNGHRPRKADSVHEDDSDRTRAASLAQQGNNSGNVAAAATATTNTNNKDHDDKEHHRNNKSHDNKDSNHDNHSPNTTAAGSPKNAVRQQQQQEQRNSPPVNNNNLDDDDEDRHSATSGMSGGSAALSGQGTDSTGSGTGGDEGSSPLFNIIFDILQKADHQVVKQQAEQTPTNRSPASPSMALEESGSATPAVKKLRSKQALLHLAKQHETSIFSQLDHKSSRALLIADPIASNIVWVNEAAERLFGRLDLVGAKLESLMPESVAVRHAGIIASYRDRYITEYRKSGSPPESRLLDIVKPRRFSVLRQVNGRSEQMFIDAWIRSLRMQDESHDEPSRIMALEAFDAQKYHEDAADARIFKAALENVSDSIVIADYNGRIEYVNKSAELLSGYPLSALLATRASVNIFLPTEMINQHEGYLQHFRQNRTASAASLQANSHEVVVSRRVEMKTAFGKEEILLRVEVAYDKLIAFLKSTREFIPREDFDNERLKLLLPASIVKLLRGATSVSDITSFFWEFDNRTVMFTDVAGFSNWAKNRPVKAVHDRMQPMFNEFETIIQAFGGELIHRIGDAVMVIFGFNGEERHHARYALACAVELQQWSINHGFLIRIGLHSGSIGAGIYGSDKGRPSFDAWGPVVNIAKRLEAHGEEGNVHISKAVRDSLGHRFANQLHMVLREKHLDDVKGMEDNATSYVIPVKADGGNQVALPEKFLQLVGFQRAKFARWKITNEETERRLAELQKASRS